MFVANWKEKHRLLNIYLELEKEERTQTLKRESTIDLLAYIIIITIIKN